MHKHLSIFLIIINVCSISPTLRRPNLIPVAISLNDNYIYQTLVTVTSLLENSKKSKYDLYIMIPQMFSSDNMNLIKSVEKKYPQKCKMNIVKMHKANGNFPFVYKYYLSKVVPDHYYRIIYLDGNNLVLNDLDQLFNEDMSDFIYMGISSDSGNFFAKINKESRTFISSSVLLVNLKRLKYNKNDVKLFSFLEDNSTYKEDDVINEIYYGKINKIHLKYGLHSYLNTKNINNYNNKLIDKYNKNDINDAFEKPIIINFNANYDSLKPWSPKSECQYKKDWWEFARRSGYEKQMRAHFGY